MSCVQDIKSKAGIYSHTNERDIVVLYAIHDLMNLSEKLKSLNIDEMADDLASIADTLRK